MGRTSPGCGSRTGKVTGAREPYKVAGVREPYGKVAGVREPYGEERARADRGAGPARRGQWPRLRYLDWVCTFSRSNLTPSAEFTRGSLTLKTSNPRKISLP